MQISTKYQNQVLHIRLFGEMDEHTAGKVRREADECIERYTDCKTEVFDLREITFMDSTGIGFLIGRYKTYKKRGVPIFIVNPSQNTDKILEMSGVYTLIPKL